MDTLNDKTLIKDKCLVAGEWIGGSETVDVTNPATGELITTVPKLGAEETERAVAGAREAMAGSAARKDRGVCLR